MHHGASEAVLAGTKAAAAAAAPAAAAAAKALVLPAAIPAAAEAVVAAAGAAAVRVLRAQHQGGEAELHHSPAEIVVRAKELLRKLLAFKGFRGTLAPAEHSTCNAGLTTRSSNTAS